MDTQTLLKEALTDELGLLYTNVTQLTAVKSLPEDDLQLLRGLVSVLQFAAQQMTQQQAAGGKLAADVTALREKVAQLQQENAAYQKQLQWIQDRIALSRTTTGKMQRKATLKQTLDIAMGITQANSASIFLLNDAKVVTECILTRSGTTERERQTLVGQVLEKGLAGWVVEHRQVETIADTSLDDRWISLPNQPYKVRSALCAPLLSDSRILGVITLTHPERNHFQPPTPKLIAAMADQIALVLENVNFHLITRTLNSRLSQHQTFCRQMLATEIAGAVMVQNNRLVQVNGCAARLFGQAPEALLHLPSIASIIAYEDLERVRSALERCHTRPLSLNYGITHKSGQVIPVSAQGISLDFRDQPAVMMILNRVDAE